MAKNRQRVVILGGGYAGVRVAHDLARRDHHRDFDIVLVSDTPWHVDTTKLYEVATAYLEVDSTASSELIRQSVTVPLNDIFAGLPMMLQIGRVDRLDLPHRLVHVGDATISYDILVICLGSVLNTYGVKGVDEHAFSVKTLNESLRLRHHLARQFHLAGTLRGPDRTAALTFVIAGAGSAGVETAAELMGHIERECAKHNINSQDVTTWLIEAGQQILSTVSHDIAAKVDARLVARGIQVRTGKPITAVTPTSVSLEGGMSLPTKTVVWTGGLKPHPVLQAAGLPLDHWGVAVDTTLRVTGHPNIYVVGDAARLTSYPETLPATVPVAYTQAACTARNIERSRRGEKLQPYRYNTVGALIAIGGKSAVATFPRGRAYQGFLPWFIKQLVTLRYWSRFISWRKSWRLWLYSLKLHAQND